MYINLYINCWHTWFTWVHLKHVIAGT